MLPSAEVGLEILKHYKASGSYAPNNEGLALKKAGVVASSVNHGTDKPRKLHEVEIKLGIPKKDKPEVSSCTSNSEGSVMKKTCVVAPLSKIYTQTQMKWMPCH